MMSALLFFTFFAMVVFGLILFFRVQYLRAGVLTKATANSPVVNDLTAFLGSMFGPAGKLINTFFQSTIEDSQNKFIAAGFYNFRFAHLYQPVKVVVLALFVLFILFFVELSKEKTIVLLSFVVIFSLILPDAILKLRASAIRNNIIDELPDFVDLLSVCTQAGMSLERSIAYLSADLKRSSRYISHVFGVIAEREKVVGLGVAIEHLNKLVEHDDIKQVVNAIKHSIKYGNSVSEQLASLATRMRVYKLRKLEAAAGSLSAKMSIPLILFIMFPLVILIVAPQLMRVML